MVRGGRGDGSCTSLESRPRGRRDLFVGVAACLRVLVSSVGLSTMQEMDSFVASIFLCFFVFFSLLSGRAGVTISVGDPSGTCVAHIEAWREHVLVGDRVMASPSPFRMQILKSGFSDRRNGKTWDRSLV